MEKATMPALFLLGALLLGASSSSPLPLRRPFPLPRHLLPPLPLHFLRPMSGSGGHPVEGLSCQSWRLAVETNNLREWKTVPAECGDYVGHYMLGHLYREDSKVVTDEAFKYATNVTLGGDGKDIWIFDIDETTLSNLPYYARNGFGVKSYNNTDFQLWVGTGKAPALPESLALYKVLLALGIKPVFLTGRNEERRPITVSNLKSAGYRDWLKLLLRGADAKGTALAYKSAERKKLVKAGFRIIGNAGDQWSDLLGSPEGARTFKLPDPMYYIG